MVCRASPLSKFQIRAVPSLLAVAANSPSRETEMAVIVLSCRPTFTGAGHAGADVSHTRPSSVVNKSFPLRPNAPRVIRPNAPPTTKGALLSKAQTSKSPVSVPMVKQLQSRPNEIQAASGTEPGAIDKACQGRASVLIRQTSKYVMTLGTEGGKMNINWDLRGGPSSQRF